MFNFSDFMNAKQVQF